MNPKEIHIVDYTYHLPEDKIAKYPLETRDQCNLLQFLGGKISDHKFCDLPDLLPPYALLVLNNTRVINARILFQKESGTQIELFCLEPVGLDYHQIFQSKSTCIWKCMVGNAKRWKGETLVKTFQFHQTTIEFKATLLEPIGQVCEIAFSWNNPQFTFGEILLYAGLIPLPPYLQRMVTKTDEIQYQTTFAKEEGSVAAPTAGLHFTQETFELLEKRNIRKTELTLHVGAGTFMPVKATQMEDHQMHRESIFVNIATIHALISTIEAKKPVVAVGTTSLRTLESMYWLGVKLFLNLETSTTLELLQWEHLDLKQDISTQVALETLLNHAIHHNLQEITATTQILITPGYRFRVLDGLITNFHQPNSTLLLLIAAFIGKDWKKIYQHALDNHYRFLSFGDSSLLWKS